MPRVIEAALIGDSHCRAIEAAAEERDITFRQTITAASPMFQHAQLIAEGDGQVTFKPSDSHFDPETQNEKTINNKLGKTRKLTNAFRQLFANPLPVFINVGTGPHAFVSRIIAAQEAANLTNPFVSEQLARRAAAEFFAEYRAFYKVVAYYCPDITCLHAPTRFNERSKNLWLAYDEQIASEMAALDTEVLDIRRAVGSDDLSLRPEYYVSNVDDQVHANTKWGAEIVSVIQSQVSLQADS